MGFSGLFRGGGLCSCMTPFAKHLHIYQTTSANRPVPNNICQPSILTLADPRTKRRDPGIRPRDSGTKWSHFLCHTFMGRVVLADGGFGLTNKNYESLDNRLTHTDVSQTSFYIKLVVQRILYLVFFVKSKIFKDYF